MGFVVMVYANTESDARALAAGIDRSRVADGRARTVGIFRYPNRAELTCRGFCMDGKMSPWSRDRFGFMKCGVCGGRHRKTRSRLIGALFDFLGANLINHTAPATFRTPEGYGPGNADSPK